MATPLTGLCCASRTMPSTIPVVSCAVSSGVRRSNNKPDAAALFVKHSKAADRVAKHSPYKNVRDKVVRRADPQKPDDSGEAVGDPRHPFMAAVPARDNGSNGKGRNRVSGGKTAPIAENGALAIEESIGEVL